MVITEVTSQYTIFYLHWMNVETTVSVQCKKKFYLTADDRTGISLIFFTMKENVQNLLMVAMFFHQLQFLLNAVLPTTIHEFKK
jgi:hypothetical protein